MKNFFRRISREQRARLLLLLALFAAGLIIYRNYILGDELLVFGDVGGDTLEQYTMHYASIVNHLRAGNFSLWDFTNGFGTSMFNLNLFDPSLMALYALGVVLGSAHMLFFLTWIQICRILAAGWCFYWFLTEFSFSRQARLVAAFTYGLSGYLLVWGQHYQFGMVTVYLPLLLLFCEKYLRNEKKKRLFPVIVFLCGIYSVYFTYMCLAGVGFYLLFRSLMMEGATLGRRLKVFLGGCVQMLLGLAMSFAIFLPMAAILLNVTSRVSQERSLVGLLRQAFTPFSVDYYSSLLTRLFSSNLQNLQNLGDVEYLGMGNYYEDPVLFCSTLSAFALVQFLILYWRGSSAKRTKRVVLAAAVFGLLLVLLPVGGLAFNAFTAVTYRYTFLVSCFLLLILAWLWDYLKAGGRASIWGILLVCAGMYPVYYLGYKNSVFSEYRVNALVLAATGTVMALLLLSINRGMPGKRLQKPLLGLLALALCVNVISEGATGYEDRITLKKEDTPVEEIEQATETYLEETSSEDAEQQARGNLIKPQNYFRELYSQGIQDALQYLEETDPEFYRVEKDFSSATISMDAQAQGYRGISTYNSVMNSNLKDFIDTCIPSFYHADRNRCAFWDIADNNWFASFCGVRYLLSKDGNLDSSKYTRIKQFRNIYLYKNVRESDVARFYDQTVSEESLRTADKKTRKKFLNQLIALEDGQERSDAKGIQETETKKASSVTLDAPEKDSLVTGTIHAAGDGYVLFMIPYEKGWSLTIDGQETKLLRGDLGFLACEVAQGDHELVLTYRAPLLAEGICLGGAAWILYLLWVLSGYYNFHHFYKKKQQEEEGTGADGDVRDVGDGLGGGFCRFHVGLPVGVKGGILLGLRFHDSRADGHTGKIVGAVYLIPIWRILHREGFLRRAGGYHHIPS